MMKAVTPVALLFVLSVLVSRPAWAVDAVKVTNTGANPIPVSGSVSVTAPAPLPVTGSVSVTATAPLPVTGTFTATLPSGVTVSNAATSPLFTSSVGDAGRGPAQITLGLQFANFYQGIGEAFTFPYVVPAGKRLVVQQVTGSVTWSVPSSPAGARIYYDTTPAQFYWLVPPVVLFSQGFSIVDGGNTQWVSAQGPAYFDGGTTLWMTAATTSGAFFQGSDALPTGHLTMIGYLLDCAQVTCAPIVSQ